MLTITPQLDTFRALADPTRRAVFERLAERELTVGQLVARFDVSQPAISQHLKTLREAGLVDVRRKGREAHYSASPHGLAPLAGWLEHYQQFWRGRGERMKKVLKEMD